VTRRIAAVAIAAGGVLYAGWFLQWLVRTDLSAMSSYISELSAADQPNHWVFRSTDLASGILIIVGSIAALLSTPRTRWAVAGWVSLILFGASTIAESQTPMSCAETASTRCARLADVGELQWTDGLHVVTSAGEDFFFGVAMLSLMIVAWHAGVPMMLRRIATTVAVAIVIAWAWTLAAAAEFELLHSNDLLGFAQRIEVTLIAIWLVLLSIELLRVRTPRSVPHVDGR
jgi:hypothetical protein